MSDARTRAAKRWITKLLDDELKQFAGRPLTPELKDAMTKRAFAALEDGVRLGIIDLQKVPEEKGWLPRTTRAASRRSRCANFTKQPLPRQAWCVAPIPVSGWTSTLTKPGGGPMSNSARAVAPHSSHVNT